MSASRSRKPALNKLATALLIALLSGKAWSANYVMVTDPGDPDPITSTTTRSQYPALNAAIDYRLKSTCGSTDPGFPSRRNGALAP